MRPSRDPRRALPTSRRSTDEGADALGTDFDSRFQYFLVLDQSQGVFTPFQGFSPGLLGFEWAWHVMTRLPADIFDLALSRRQRIARRATGLGAYRWMPLDIAVLPALLGDGLGPLIVLFSQDDAVAAAIDAWREGSGVDALHISTVVGPRRIPRADVTVKDLKRYAFRVVRRTMPDGAARALALEVISKWKAPPGRRSSLRFRSHNVSAPNEMALALDGIRPSRGEPLDPSDDRDYVEAIVASVHNVRELRQAAAGALVHPSHPPRPDTLLFAPAMYADRYRRDAFAGLEQPGLRETFRLLRAQRGYAFQAQLDDAILGTPGWSAVMGTRSQELRVITGGVGALAASIVAGAIRLPAAVNRTRNTVAALAAHLRAHPEAEQKTARVFATVQQALAASVPAALLDLVRQSRSGLKIVADAPLEWLPVDGLPLSLRFQTARVDVTPGDLALGELANPSQMVMPPEAFQEVLVVTSFASDDPIREDLIQAIGALLPPGTVRVRISEARSADELVAALNAFEGPLAVFDGHGAHEAADGHGALILGAEKVDVWTLRGRVRFPPIMVLSACDTHAIDRSHATVANGLLACGVRAVLATFLPVRSRHSAVFVARLLLRATTFTRAVAKGPTSLTWTEVVTGMLRTQLISDLVLALTADGALSAAQAQKLILDGGSRVAFQQSDWWEALLQDVAEATAQPLAEVQTQAARVIAASDVIRYVHLGSPETIVIADPAIIPTAGGA